MRVDIRSILADPVLKKKLGDLFVRGVIAVGRDGARPVLPEKGGRGKQPRA